MNRNNKKKYYFFYLLLIYLFANNTLLIKILYEFHHKQSSLFDIKELIYSSFLINVIFILITGCYMLLKIKHNKDINSIRQSLFDSPLFQSIMDKVKVGVIITDSNGIIKFANIQASNITEFPLDEILQKHYSKIFILLHSGDNKSSRFILEKVLDNGCVISNKLPRTIICHDNRKKDILSSAAPIVDKQGIVSGALLSFLDITTNFAQISNISQENRNLNQTLQLADLCYFKKNIVTGKIHGSANLSHFWAYNSNNIAYSPEEWIHPADLNSYNEKIQQFLSSTTNHTELIFRSNFYSETKYFHQIIYKNTDKNIITGTFQDITQFVNFNHLIEQKNDNTQKSNIPATTQSHKKPSMLIVDYEINNCNVLALTFTKLNYNVRVTTTPNSALEYLKNCKVDIVLANLELPNMNAIEFAKELRIRWGFDIMIYVILSDPSQQNKFNLHIFNGVLIKPITLEQIKKIF